jgi:hypothetical protein
VAVTVAGGTDVRGRAQQMGVVGQGVRVDEGRGRAAV